MITDKLNKASAHLGTDYSSTLFQANILTL